MIVAVSWIRLKTKNQYFAVRFFICPQPACVKHFKHHILKYYWVCRVFLIFNFSHTFFSELSCFWQSHQLYHICNNLDSSEIAILFLVPLLHVRYTNVLLHWYGCQTTRPVDNSDHKRVMSLNRLFIFDCPMICKTVKYIDQSENNSLPLLF